MRRMSSSSAVNQPEASKDERSDMKSTQKGNGQSVGSVEPVANMTGHSETPGSHTNGPSSDIALDGEATVPDKNMQSLIDTMVHCQALLKTTMAQYKGFAEDMLATVKKENEHEVTQERTRAEVALADLAMSKLQREKDIKGHMERINELQEALDTKTREASQAAKALESANNKVEGLQFSLEAAAKKGLGHQSHAKRVAREKEELRDKAESDKRSFERDLASRMVRIKSLEATIETMKRQKEREIKGFRRRKKGWKSFWQR
ncbi:hypothetical protein BD324DRAFT_620694 [Kockovaella imperatae]|uniref:Uncharacterized protein n=1 Tax=Kockovaella imperatae TaxID=4999 RepID=A0A1Y1UMN7_9TREE|nr:hypothetical protein BD324DRAFT_620694 [Kockovaella imperatae]ORX38395.1 hypothetical protein BD324DRAFT_620694 [Kockovaella imperatae]